jgi:hypothetical protein
VSSILISGSKQAVYEDCVIIAVFMLFVDDLVPSPTTITLPCPVILGYYQHLLQAGRVWRFTHRNHE